MFKSNEEYLAWKKSRRKIVARRRAVNRAEVIVTRELKKLRSRMEAQFLESAIRISASLKEYPG